MKSGMADLMWREEELLILVELSKNNKKKSYWKMRHFKESIHMVN